MTNANELIHSFNHTPDTEGNFNGLTKREYFAAMAMQGLMTTLIPSEQAPNLENVSYMANLSAAAADALINALNETI